MSMFNYLSEKQRLIAYSVVCLCGYAAALVFGIIAAHGDMQAVASAVASFVAALSANLAAANVGDKGLDSPQEYPLSLPAVAKAHEDDGMDDPKARAAYHGRD